MMDFGPVKTKGLWYAMVRSQPTIPEGQKGPYAVPRIRPSEQIGKQLDELLDNGPEGQDNLVGTLVQLGVQLVVQELLERETTERLRRVLVDVLDLPGVLADEPAPHARHDIAHCVFGKRGLGEPDDGPDPFQGEAVLSGVGRHPAAEQSRGLGRAQEAVVGQVLDRPSPVVRAQTQAEPAVSGDDLHGGVIVRSPETRACRFRWPANAT